MGQTTTYALPWPELGTTADGPSAVQALANATEAALKRTRGWIGRRVQNDDVAAAVWGFNAGVTVPSAPAGSYLITSILYWWCGMQTRESVYTWHGITVSGTRVLAMPVGGISGGADQPMCSVLQHLQTIGSGGGSVSFSGDMGFSNQPVRAFSGGSLSVVRVTDA